MRYNTDIKGGIAMQQIGESLYGLRIVKSYHVQDYEERPLFSGFVGIVVANA